MQNKETHDTKSASAPKGRDGKSTRGRLTRFRTLFDPSRSGAVFVIVVTVGIYAAVRLARPLDTHHAQLRFVEERRAESSDTGTVSQVAYREPLSSTGYETALRLREAGALGMAVSLSIFAKHASTGKAPATNQEVIREMAIRQLTPPGIEVGNGTLRSNLSELRLSYRPQPLSFELLALPKEGATGSALLLKFPLPAGESNSVIYFESATSVPVPAPFSTNERVAAAGWRIRQWRGDALPLNDSVVRELREQNNWMKSVNQRR